MIRSLLYKLASPFYKLILAIRIHAWIDPVGIYKKEKNDFRIHYQNQAALSHLKIDNTGKLLCEVFPNHLRSVASSILQEPDKRLIDIYLEVANTGVPCNRDICYIADGVDAWYKIKVLNLGFGFIAITWVDVSEYKLTLDRQAIYMRVQQALLHQAFCLYFQRIVRLQDRSIVGYEALVRWRLENGIIIYPDKFIPAIQGTDAIVLLTWEVIRLACAKLQDWIVQGIHSDCYISVNIPPYALADPYFESKFYRILETFRTPPQRLVFEITEESIVPDWVLPRLRRLSEQGIRIVIDDFGTGTNSLKTLHDMSFAYMVKIDQFYIKDLLHNPVSQTLVTTLVSIAFSLGMTVTAEGVEDEETATWLYTAFVKQGQGWLWGKADPMN